MNIVKKHSKMLGFLLVSWLAVILVSGCSGIKDAQIKSPDIAVRGVMAASNREAAEVPKYEEIVNQKQVSKADRPSELGLPQLSAPQNEAPITEPQEADLEVITSPQTNSADPIDSTVSEPNFSAPVKALPRAEVNLTLAAQPQVGFRAPDFALQALDGQSIQLADYLGWPLVINYWATWCIPCKQELPIIEKLHKEYGEKGVTIISVNAIDQDNIDKVQAMVGELGMTFPVLLDQDRIFADAYQAIFFPTTYMIDASGVIREVSLGDNTEEELRDSLDRLLTGGY
jgi:peroxiredoxin